MSATPLFSIVIACYNGEEFLDEAIQSVLKQSYKHFEIIAIDDGSTDDTSLIVQAYPTVNYISQQNKGVCKARNVGLQNVNGKYLIFLDQDDFLPSQRLENDLIEFSKNSSCAYIFGWTAEVDSEGNKIRSKSEITPYFDTVDYSTVLEGHLLVPPGTVTFDVDKLKSVSGFNELLRSSEDLDLYLRLAQQYPIFCHNQITLYYRRHNNNWSSRYGETMSLSEILARLDEQKKEIHENPQLLISCLKGKTHWKNLLGPRCVGELIMVLKNKDFRKASSIFFFLLLHCPTILLSELSDKIIQRIKGQPIRSKK